MPLLTFTVKYQKILEIDLSFQYRLYGTFGIFAGCLQHERQVIHLTYITKVLFSRNYTHF